MAGTDPGAFEARAAGLREAYSSVEVALLGMIARRLAVGLGTPAWKSHRLAQARALARELQPRLATLDRSAEREIRSLLRDTHADALEAARPSLERIGVEPAEPDYSVESAVRYAAASFRQAHRVALASAIRAYRGAVDRTAAAVDAGAEPRAALQVELDRMAEAGITGFVDSRGAAWSMDSFAEMAARTAIANTHMATKRAVFRASGVHYFRVSKGGSCPPCEAWEGEVLTDLPEDEVTAAVDDAYADGVFHPNCSHTVDAEEAPAPGTLAAEEADMAAEWDRLNPGLREAQAQDAAAAAARQEASDRLRGLPAFDRNSAFSVEPGAYSENKGWAKAQAFGDRHAAGVELTQEERTAMSRYASQDFEQINSGLREGAAWVERNTDIEALDRAIGKEVLQRDTVVYRGQPGTFFDRLGVPNETMVLNDEERMTALQSLVGQVVEEPGYFSTAVDGNQAFARAVRLEVEVPKGTNALWMDIIQKESGERLAPETELLLPRGLRYAITKIEPGDDRFGIFVKVRVLPAEGEVVVPAAEVASESTVAAFTEADVVAVSDYQTASSGLNGALRAGGASAEERAQIAAVDTAFEHAAAITEDAVLYRGMPYNTYVNAEIRAMKAKDAGKAVHLTDKAFLSTTPDRAMADYFATQNPYSATGLQRGKVVEIRIPAGTKVLKVDEMTGTDTKASEWLLPRGSKFTLDFSGPGQPVLTLVP